MYVNKSKRVPFYIFWHYAAFFERKNTSKISFFPKKVLRFLSLRYSADFRRSRLVQIEQDYNIPILNFSWERQKRYLHVNLINQIDINDPE